MAYELVSGGTKRFIGTSADAKPLSTGTSADSTFIPAGSTCLESDTGRIYRWDGSAWRFGAAQDDAVTELLSAQYFELVRLRRATEISVGIDPDEPAG